MSRFKLLLLLLAIAALAVGLAFWWRHQEIYPSSDDAYLQAHILTIAPQIGGAVSEVAIAENQRVEQNAVLFRIDSTDLELARDAAMAQVELARRTALAVGDNVAAASAQLAGARASLENAASELARNEELLNSALVARSVVDQFLAQRNEAAAQVAAAQANLTAAKSQAGTRGEDNPSVRAAVAQLKRAARNLQYSEVSAPATGWIANLSLRPGQVVTADQPLFSLVEDGSWWVDANFKETDLQRIRPDQPATVTIDMYPGVELHGTVESIGAGSGAAFSLLPPENATGNWVKVTQRFPVRIKIARSPADQALQLRVGASVTATVDTTGRQ
ncbi:MAG: HlyD family secretion protein [Steroidobacteraceae bacterium]